LRWDVVNTGPQEDLSRFEDERIKKTDRIGNYCNCCSVNWKWNTISLFEEWPVWGANQEDLLLILICFLSLLYDCATAAPQKNLELVFKKLLTNFLRLYWDWGGVLPVPWPLHGSHYKLSRAMKRYRLKIMTISLQNSKYKLLCIYSLEVL